MYTQFEWKVGYKYPTSLLLKGDFFPVPAEQNRQGPEPDGKQAKGKDADEVKAGEIDPLQAEDEEGCKSFGSAIGKDDDDGLGLELFFNG